VELDMFQNSIESPTIRDSKLPESGNIEIPNITAKNHFTLTQNVYKEIYSEYYETDVDDYNPAVPNDYEKVYSHLMNEIIL
jgi:hypothetical protein